MPKTRGMKRSFGRRRSGLKGTAVDLLPNDFRAHRDASDAHDLALLKSRSSAMHKNEFFGDREKSGSVCRTPDDSMVVDDCPPARPVCPSVPPYFWPVSC